MAGDEPWVTMSVQRGAAPDDGGTVMLQNIDAEPVALLADGEPLPVRLEATVDGHRVVAEDQAALVATLLRARTLEARGADGTTVGRISLSGSSAAMLYIDEQQRRIGTTTAWVRTGRDGPETIPAAPPLPVVTLSPGPGGEAPIAPSEPRIEALRREAGCTIEEVGGPDHHDAVAIAPGRTLLLLACGSGAYNVTAIPYIVERAAGGTVSIRLAEFDSQWGLGDPELRRPTLINAAWDAERRRLREYAKGRGLGDCGTRSEYGWDGARFRLVRREEMEECRGSLQYIPTWNAETTGP
jgi:hypothetical protein